MERPANHDPAQIKDLPLFQGLKEAELARLLQGAHLSKLGEGGFYFFQDDPAERVFVLVAGRVKLLKSNPGEQPSLMRMIRPVSVFGAIAIAQNETYPVSAQAAEDSQALYWTRAEMVAFIAEFPQLAFNAMDIIAGHVQEFQARFHQMATERVERRLARMLIRLASQAGKKTSQGVLIDLPLSRQDLAEMTGTTLYTVSRTLSHWEAQGLVTTGRERVVIRSPHRLVCIAEDIPQSHADADQDEDSL